MSKKKRTEGSQEEPRKVEQDKWQQKSEIEREREEEKEQLRVGEGGGEEEPNTKGVSS